jgi:ATP-binding cassette subfamily F protein uup
VLDEPTTDLDVETLEALEDRLTEYDGTLILVSHDRYFLDSVVTSTLVFEADGHVRRHAGGYSDWLARDGELAVIDTPIVETADNAKVERTKSLSRKLSYKLQRELDALPNEIEQLEARVGAQRDTVSDPAFYQRPHADVQEQLDALRELEEQLERNVERWAELEQLATDIATGSKTAEP